MGSAKRHDASVQSADPTRDELDETFEILDRDGAVVVFGGDLMERGFGIVSAKATEDTRLSSSAKGVYAYFCAHAGAETVSIVLSSFLIFCLRQNLLWLKVYTVLHFQYDIRCEVQHFL